MNRSFLVILKLAKVLKCGLKCGIMRVAKKKAQKNYKKLKKFLRFCKILGAFFDYIGERPLKRLISQKRVDFIA